LPFKAKPARREIETQSSKPLRGSLQGASRTAGKSTGGIEAEQNLTGQWKRQSGAGFTWSSPLKTKPARRQTEAKNSKPQRENLKDNKPDGG